MAAVRSAWLSHYSRERFLDRAVVGDGRTCVEQPEVGRIFIDPVATLAAGFAQNSESFKARDERVRLLVGTPE